MFEQTNKMNPSILTCHRSEVVSSLFGSLMDLFMCCPVRAIVETFVAESTGEGLCPLMDDLVSAAIALIGEVLAALTAWKGNFINEASCSRSRVHSRRRMEHSLLALDVLSLCRSWLHRCWRGGECRRLRGGALTRLPTSLQNSDDLRM